MPENRFSDSAPLNGVRARLLTGQPEPTPYHVEVYKDGQIVDKKRFESKAEAEQFCNQVMKNAART